MTRRSRIAFTLICMVLSALLLACVSLPWATSEGAVAQAIPRFACQTPTARPYGPDGPVKGYQDGAPDPTTGIPIQEPIYYTIWEQEYGQLGDPAPAPTTYARSGYGFYFGQVVNLSPLLDAQATVQRTEIVSGSMRLFEAKLTWHNRGAPFAFSAARQLAISAIERADGTRISGDGWTWNRDAAILAGQEVDAATLRSEVPVGDSEQIVPILAPEGQAQVLDLRLDLAGEGSEVQQGGLRVQWSRAIDPACDNPGSIAASYLNPAQPLQGPPPPANATDLVAWAYSQIGRPYCWGGKGESACAGNPQVRYADACPARQGLPCWDCSGLMWGAYRSVGVILGHGTSNQSRYPVVWQWPSAVDPASVAQPGDLLLFAGTDGANPVGGIHHVGLYAGDGVMVHAANYPDGVIPTPHVFTTRYYKTRLALITRPPRT